MARDYIPRKTDEFNIFQNNLAKAAEANAADWNIPADEVTALTGSSDKYRKLYKANSNKGTRTTVDIKKHLDFRTGYEKDIRHFVNRFIRSNKAIPDSIKSSLGIKVLGKRRRQRSLIEDAVLFTMTPVGGSRMLFRCRMTQAMGKSHLHPEADGVEICYVVGAKPSSTHETTHSFISTKAHFYRLFSDAQQGQMVYAYARWKNLKNDDLSGGWGAVRMERLY